MTIESRAAMLSVPFRPAPFRGVLPALLAATLVLAGCAGMKTPSTTPVPPERPGDLETGTPAPSAASAEMRARLQRLQDSLVARGLMRQDGGGADTPFNARQLADNFIQIALYDEYVTRNGRLVSEVTPSHLRRWDQPVTMAVAFGDTIPEAQRKRDSRDISDYAARLARISGHSIRMAPPERANYTVLVLNEDDRRGYGDQLEALVPGIDPVSRTTILNLPSSTYCVVFAFSNGDASVYSRAVAVIRGEHPDRMRLSCIHEEIAQGLGLANDSPAARPSIFNDDEEFALLTRMDEMMLKMLYDPRLRPGMTPDEARPIVEQIAKELMGEA